MKNLLSMEDLTNEEILSLVKRALELKKGVENKKRNDVKILEKYQKQDSEQKFNMEKIKDETMLAAMMAALIEAAGDNKDSRIRIKNIREIK